MTVSWSLLRNPEPTALAAARQLAHRAVQWPARAARANLAPVRDDSHASLAWDAERSALVTAPLKRGVQVGLRVGLHELAFFKDDGAEAFSLVGVPDAEGGQWLDARLHAEGLKPATGVRLPYELKPALMARAAEERANLAALAAWFAAGEQLLEALRGRYGRQYKTSPVRLWPHHFDIALAVELERWAPGSRAIGIGLSPGDEFYAQPYFYVSPYPRPDTEVLPALPRGGRWHTREFFGVVATAIDVLALPDPEQGLFEIVDAAFADSLERLKTR